MNFGTIRKVHKKLKNSKKVLHVVQKFILKKVIMNKKKVKISKSNKKEANFELQNCFILNTNLNENYFLYCKNFD